MSNYKDNKVRYIQTKQLEKYGKLEKLEETEEEVHILITDGFSNKNTFDFLNSISYLFPFHPKIRKAITNKNYCEIILKK